jgi:hypothetical protein
VKSLRRAISIIGPSVVLGTLAFFVYYSLNIYQSTGHVACYSSAIARQTDVAVHVVRQWFGREGQLYQACP